MNSLNRLYLAVLSLFDRGVEGLIGDLTRLDSKLDRLAQRRAAQVELIDGRITANNIKAERAAQIAKAKNASLQDQAFEHHLDAERAKRIRSRIASLVE